MTVSTELCRELYRLAEDHNGQDVEIALSGVPLLVVQDMDSAQHVLRRNAGNYEKNMPWFRQALGASRMTENGAAWRQRQQLTQGHFAQFDRQLAFERCVRAGERTVVMLIDAAGRGAERIDDNVLRTMAASVMLESFFDLSLEEAGVDIADIARLIAFGSEYAFLPAGERPPFERGSFAAFLDLRAKVLRDLAAFRGREATEGSVLARLRAAEAEGTPGFVLEHELTLFFAAGAETTAASMGWALFLLAGDPALQRELHRAADAFWSAGARDWAALQRLSEFENFTAEVLRIFPPTPVVGRRAVGSDVVGSRAVAAGDQILVSIVGVQHDRALHPEPWRVDLGRTRNAGPNSGQSFSFGVGPRVCAGSRFAMLEMMAFIATFLRVARFEPTSDGRPQFRWQSQLLHEAGQPVRVLAR